MIYITLTCVIITILSISYFFLQLLKRYLFQDKIENLKLKLIISSSFWILFWILSYSLNSVYERIQHPVIKDGVEQYAGTLGDLVGGVLNPVLAVFGIVAAGLAFYAQYEANKLVQEQFKIQQFESQLYEMIRLHRENLNEMEIGSAVHGRKCFVRMFQEYKFIYLKLFEIYRNNSTHKSKLDKFDLCEITYLVFFFGISLNTIDVITKLIKPKHQKITDELFESLKSIKNKWKESENEYVAIVQNEQGINFSYKVIYTPFDGHNTRLGHYYRHLYQTVSFVVNSQIITNRDKKYSYLKLIRAQLSNHEQLLLYYNSLTKFGKGWIDNGYFTNFKMIKNIPLEFADFGVTPKSFFGNKNDFDENIFEWDEL